jgi:hypothetical protein
MTWWRVRAVRPGDPRVYWIEVWAETEADALVAVLKGEGILWPA